MKKYKCLLCNTNPVQLSHHKKHLQTQKHLFSKKIELDKLCNDGIDKETIDKKILNQETYPLSTQFCYIDNKKIFIDEYEENITTLETKSITDKDGNELIFCCGQKVKPYFRRKEISKIGDWHLEWQSHFPDHTEIYHKKRGNQIKARRSDVDLSDDIVIEFQDSYIKKEEVIERTHDYKNNHSKDIIWVIRGDDIQVTHDINLEFDSKWKYTSFTACQYVYLDIRGMIYKLPPQDVKNQFITANKPITKSMFVDSLKENKINTVFEPTKPKQAKLYVNQMGAGNGKTYSAVQLLKNPEFSCYSTFVYLTKQHSAKHIIFKELKNQKERGLLDCIIFNDDDFEMDTKQKYRLIKCEVNTKPIKIVIGTFDSLIYRFFHQSEIKNSTGFNVFNDWALRIAESENVTLEKYEYINKIKFSKKVLLIGDEMQDLHPNYSKCILRILSDTYSSFFAVGDKLQSISIELNSFTILENNKIIPENIEFIKFDPINISRRFKSSNLVAFVNKIVNFEKFGLSKFSLSENTSEDHNSSVEIFSSVHDSLFRNKTIDLAKIEDEVNLIMEYYKMEVDNGRNANDFLIVTPIMKGNAMIEKLNLAIREFWQIKNKSETYEKYSYVHKAEKEGSVDLSISEDLTRIVTIHTSKGDQRKVVFVVGVTESALKTFSEKYNAEGTEGKLIYESLLHVAVTRMQEKLYIHVQTNQDDIHRRLKGICNLQKINPEIKISKKIHLKKLIKESDVPYVNKNIVELSQCSDIYAKVEHSSGNKNIIEMGHHNVRCGMMVIISMLKIDQYESKMGLSSKNGHKRQFYAIFKKLSTCRIEKFDNYEAYYDHFNEIEENKNQGKNDPLVIPMYAYRHCKGDYEKYYAIIIQKLNDAKQFLIKYFKTYDLALLTYQQSIFLFYMKELMENHRKSSFSVSELYDIVHIIQNPTDVLDKIIKFHYEAVAQLDKWWDGITNSHTNINYLTGYTVNLESKTEDISIFMNFRLIGYNKDEVYIFMITPHVTQLNITELVIDNIYQTFIVKNVKRYNKNNEEAHQYIKFKNKQVITYIISLENKPIKLIWNDGKDVDFIHNETERLIEILQTNTKFYLNSFNNSIWEFYRHHKKNKRIEEIIRTYRDQSSIDSHPKYVEEIFQAVKYSNNDYATEQTFISKLESLIQELTDEFFGLERPT